MPSVRCWTVDAFTDRPFGGNPASVCWLEEEKETAWMQSVAAEMNLSETAFVRARKDGYELRWFTPTMEVDLCGHATLATAHTLWSAKLAENGIPLRFHTRSGLLSCVQSGDMIELDFPSLPSTEILVSPLLEQALGVPVVAAGASRIYQLAVLESAAAVRACRPDFQTMIQIPTLGVIITAAGDDGQFDIVSRFFAPAMGVNEDPVCGSAHCVLAPYWSSRLGKTELRAHQASARGGVLHLTLKGERVALRGHAVTVWRGEIL
ncbi:MAG: PhzF family phenazine biosynthesis protein [Planctomycetes bacterium]|nr:PhzF family phenazine biosynthesis protein [Planctomycetota bacterium]